MGFVAHDHDVTFLDVRQERVDALRAQGWQAKLVGKEGAALPDFVFVAVSAPTNARGVDLTHLKEATARLGRKLRESPSDKRTTIVFRCTMPPGTMRGVLIPILERNSGMTAGDDFGVAYNPEYLRAVSSEDDFLHPRLVTLATFAEGDRSHRDAATVLGSFGADVWWMPMEVAEFHKYVNNVGNAVKISTYNYFRALGKEIGLSAEQVDKAFAASSRTAEGLWNPLYGLRDFGPFGGACLPKDTEALRIYTEEMGYDTALLKVTQDINSTLEPPAELAG